MSASFAARSAPFRLVWRWSPRVALFESRKLDACSDRDHLILLGEVERYSCSGLPPLVFYGGRFAGVSEVLKSLYLPSKFDAWQTFYDFDLP